MEMYVMPVYMDIERILRKTLWNRFDLILNDQSSLKILEYKMLVVLLKFLCQAFYFYVLFNLFEVHGNFNHPEVDENFQFFKLFSFYSSLSLLLYLNT